LTKITNLM